MHDGYIRSKIATTGAERMGLQRLTHGPGGTGKEQGQALLNGVKWRLAQSGFQRQSALHHGSQSGQPGTLAQTKSRKQSLGRQITILQSFLWGIEPTTEFGSGVNRLIPQEKKGHREQGRAIKLRGTGNSRTPGSGGQAAGQKVSWNLEKSDGRPRCRDASQSGSDLWMMSNVRIPPEWLGLVCKGGVNLGVQLLKQNEQAACGHTSSLHLDCQRTGPKRRPQAGDSVVQ